MISKQRKQILYACTFLLLVFVVFMSFFYFKRDLNRYFSYPQEQDNASPQETVHLLHSSSDLVSTVSRQLGDNFVAWYKKKTGIRVRFDQVFGEPLQQARNVAYNLPADLVSSVDVRHLDLIHVSKKDQSQLLPRDWQNKYPNESSPAKTTLVLMVRGGNPKKIREWKDLVRPGIEVVASDYRSFDGKRIIECAFVYGLHKYRTGLGSTEIARSFVKDLMDNTIVSNEDSRGAFDVFLNQGKGDVLIAYETHANRMLHTGDAKDFEIVTPSYSMEIEVFVAVVEGNVERKGTQNHRAAKAFWDFVYSPEGQRIVAENFFRPLDTRLLRDYRAFFSKTELFDRKDMYIDGLSMDAALFDRTDGIISKMLREEYEREAF